MNPSSIEQLARDLVIVLTSGFVAGVLCRRLGISLMVGYLLIGAVIGEGGLRLVGQHHQELEYLARGGVQLLLFAIGIEFSLTDLARLSRFFFVGGSVQMSIVAIIIGSLAALYLPGKAAVLLGAAVALSSTVIVFRALSERGESRFPHGRRTIAILLFQDVALVPLMLLIPLLAAEDGVLDLRLAALLAAKTVGSVIVVLLLPCGAALGREATGLVAEPGVGAGLHTLPTRLPVMECRSGRITSSAGGLRSGPRAQREPVDGPDRRPHRPLSRVVLRRVLRDSGHADVTTMAA